MPGGCNAISGIASFLSARCCSTPLDDWESELVHCLTILNERPCSIHPATVSCVLLYSSEPECTCRQSGSGVTWTDVPDAVLSRLRKASMAGVQVAGDEHIAASLCSDRAEFTCMEVRRYSQQRYSLGGKMPELTSDDSSMTGLKISLLGLRFPSMR